MLELLPPFLGIFLAWDACFSQQECEPTGAAYLDRLCRQGHDGTPVWSLLASAMEQGIGIKGAPVPADTGAPTRISTTIGQRNPSSCSPLGMGEKDGDMRSCEAQDILLDTRMLATIAESRCNGIFLKSPDADAVAADYRQIPPTLLCYGGERAVRPSCPGDRPRTSDLCACTQVCWGRPIAITGCWWAFCRKGAPYERKLRYSSAKAVIK